MKIIIALLMFLFFPTTPTKVVVTKHRWTAIVQLETFEISSIYHYDYLMYAQNNVVLTPTGKWIEDDEPLIQHGEGKDINPYFHVRRIDPYYGLRHHDERISRRIYFYRIEVKDPESNKKWTLRIGSKNWRALKKGDIITAAVNSFGGIIDLKRK